MIEADFQRDYGLDLGDTLETMSWRRFCALLVGLSPGSTTVALAGADRQAYEGAEAEEMARKLWR